jgi:2-polyprenyl-6-methoxyphenol hydroxylase-like FAD-dependent oxidoreductase
MNTTVLISGAGIAGPTLAYWLSLSGFGPTLIERAPVLRTGGYIMDFWGVGFDVAERMHLLSRLKHISTVMRTSTSPIVVPENKSHASLFATSAQFSL